MQKSRGNEPRSPSASSSTLSPNNIGLNDGQEGDDSLADQRLWPICQMGDDSIDTLHREVGFLVSSFPTAVVLADALLPDCPIIGASDLFEEFSGYSREDVLGQNVRFLLNHVPDYCISRSAQKNMRSMTRMSRLFGLSAMGSASCQQMNSNRKGEVFMNSMAVAVVLIHEHPFLVGVLSKFERSKPPDLDTIQHGMLEELRVILKTGQMMSIEAVAPEFFPPQPRKLMGDRRYLARALTERVILMNDCRTVSRREPTELPNGCVVMGGQPLRYVGQSLFFAVRLEGVLHKSWSSWPVIGMTRVSPEEMAAQGYPLKAEWCGRSVCLGGDFQAFSRQSETHFRAGFKKPKTTEVVSFDGPRPRYSGRTATPWDLQEGDVMGMLYAPNGEVTLMLNYRSVLSFDTGLQLESGDYWALVDCQGAAYEMTLLPYESPGIGLLHEECCSDQPLIERKAFKSEAQTAVARAVASCACPVSIADPSEPNIPVVAVSPAFEEMSGFTNEDIVGFNHKMLSRHCDISLEERLALREAFQTGRRLNCILQNRRKSGELFVNFLCLRGLRVARDAETGEDIWYLVRVQCDVTNSVDEAGDVPASVREKNARGLDEVAALLQKELRAGCSRCGAASVRQADLTSEDRPDRKVVVPATQGVEAQPKPEALPMIAVLPEAAWMTATLADHSNELEVLSPSPSRRGSVWSNE